MPLENEPLIDDLIRLMHDMNGFITTLHSDCVSHGRPLDDYRDEYVFNTTRLREKYDELWTNIRSIAESPSEYSTVAGNIYTTSISDFDNSDDDSEPDEQEECDEEVPPGDVNRVAYIFRPGDLNNVEPVIGLPPTPPVTGHWADAPSGGYTFIPDTHIGDSQH